MNIVKFSLTSIQKKMLRPLFIEAKQDYDKGKKGCVLAQCHDEGYFVAVYCSHELATEINKVFEKSIHKKKKGE